MSNEIEHTGDHQITPILQQILELLTELRQQNIVKDWYTTADFAKLTNKAEFTIREYCRHGRIRAKKQGSGRGLHTSWSISREELLRYQKEGLLPIRTTN